MSEPGAQSEQQPSQPVPAVETKAEAPSPAQNVELKLTEDSPDALDGSYKKQAADLASGALARLIKFGQDSGIKVS